MHRDDMTGKTVHLARFQPEGVAPVQELEDANPGRVIWPEGAISFVLLRREDEVVDGCVYPGVPSPADRLRYFHHDSRVLSLDEVRQRPASGYLAANMEANELSHVIYVRGGEQALPFFPNEMRVVRPVEAPEIAQTQSSQVLTTVEVWAAMGGAAQEVPAREELLAMLRRLAQGSTERSEPTEPAPVSARARERLT